MERKKIFDLVKDYYKQQEATMRKAFSPGDRIQYAGRVFDEDELITLVDASLDFWLTAGRFAAQLESRLSQFLNVRHTLLVNSGSSANLLAFYALTSPALKERRILPGDEVITVAAAFPTTIAPIIQSGAVPVFVDVETRTYNVRCEDLEAALSRRTKAVMLAHTLGNPFDIQAVKNFCRKHSLWLIEDNCDALGSRYQLDGTWGYTGSFGDLGTSSFYPAHHMTTGEGGAVYCQSSQLRRIVESFRDWGRDCWCSAGKDNTCSKRFASQHGDLPFGYDHKYVYSHFGFNLKLTDMQAAVGCAQLKKLPAFIEARKRNWAFLYENLRDLEDRLILPLATPGSDPSWFGFVMTVRDTAGFTRDDLVQFLESRNIQTRMLFAGNILRHPCFDEMRAAETGYRVIGDLKNTDKILSSTFWIGVYPGITEDMAALMADSIREFCRKR